MDEWMSGWMGGWMAHFMSVMRSSKVHSKLLYLSITKGKLIMRAPLIKAMGS